MRLKLPTLATAFVATALLAPSTDGQSLRILAQNGQNLPGIGDIVGFNNKTVNDFGDWIAEAFYNPDSPTEVIIRNGVVTQLEGTFLAEPSGASVASFGTTGLDALGHITWILSLNGTAGGTADNSGVYYDGTMLAQESGDVLAPQLSSGTVWKTFKTVVVATANDRTEVLLAADVDDPNINTTLDAALIRWTVDPDTGEILERFVFAKETDVLPSTGNREIRRIESNVRTFDMNVHGDVVYSFLVAGSGANEYLFLNDQIMAREGGGSPVPDRTWKSMTGLSLSINDHGDVLFRGQLNSPVQDDLLLCLNNEEVVYREGEVIAGMSPRRLASFDKAPIILANSGDVFWYGDFSGSAGFDTAILVNDHVIARENTTLYDGGARLNQVNGKADGFDVSPSGRYIILEGTRAGGGEILFLVDLGLITPVAGCEENEGTLKKKSGFAIVGGDFTLDMDNGQTLGSLTFLIASQDLIPGYPPCGLSLPYGELLANVLPPDPLAIFTGLPWGEQPVPYDLSVPLDPELVDLNFFVQGIFVNNIVPDVPRFRLTNALEIVVGAP